MGTERGWKRHTGVLEGTPSSEAALGHAHNLEDAGSRFGNATFYQKCEASRLNPFSSRAPRSFSANSAIRTSYALMVLKA
jgi:hypothetical protein